MTSNAPEFQIFACALRDSLVARAMAGDAGALTILLKFLPKDLPANFRKGERDRRIRALAARIHELHPEREVDPIAKILTKAGRQLQTPGRGLTGRVFKGLDPDELDHIKIEIADILTWAPPTSPGNRWPDKRRITDIIKNLQLTGWKLQQR